MSTTRDVVRAIAERAGVVAVVVLSPDGIPIDSSTAADAEADSLAATVPRTGAASRDLGATAWRGVFSTGVVVR